MYRGIDIDHTPIAEGYYLTALAPPYTTIETPRDLSILSPTPMANLFAPLILDLIFVFNVTPRTSYEVSTRIVSGVIHEEEVYSYYIDFPTLELYMEFNIDGPPRKRI
ncbi:hypothetical protein N7504_006280 [Penicillium tannophilum]|nr:hypothetical protein N7504_006280 [Penicillium tannophilum]